MFKYPRLTFPIHLFLVFLRVHLCTCIRNAKSKSRWVPFAVILQLTCELFGSACFGCNIVHCYRGNRATRAFCPLYSVNVRIALNGVAVLLTCPTRLDPLLHDTDIYKTVSNHVSINIIRQFDRLIATIKEQGILNESYAFNQGVFQR